MALVVRPPGAERRSVLAASIRGRRGLVRYSTDPGWNHERVFLWPVAQDTHGICSRWVIRAPGGHMYAESSEDWSFLRLLERNRYPADGIDLVHFEDAIDDAASFSRRGVSRLRPFVLVRVLRLRPSLAGR